MKNSIIKHIFNNWTWLPKTFIYSKGEHSQPTAKAFGLSLREYHTSYRRTPKSVGMDRSGQHVLRLPEPD